MKKITAILLSMGFVLISFSPAAQVGKVGINTSTPEAMLHVKDSSVVFTGSFTTPPGNTPVSGPGIRMMWYADKGAFRTGRVSGNHWDKDSVGHNSFASGFDTKATNNYSTAMGYLSRATEFTSVAIGYDNLSSGSYSTAIGGSAIASGNSTTSVGISTLATGIGASAFGNNTNATGQFSTAIGAGSTASGIESMAFGILTVASGGRSTSMGSGSVASGDFSLAAGYLTVASGVVSTSMGSGSVASGDYSLAAGRVTNASGDYSFSIGRNTAASGDFASAIGDTVTARSYSSMTIGRYNDSIVSSSPGIWVNTDPIFIIGNGTANNARRNAFIVAKNSETGINIANGMPQAGLHIKGIAATFDAHLRLESAGGSTDYCNILYDGNTKFRNFGAGDEFQWRNSTNNIRMTLDDLGNLTIAGIYTPSDAKLKKNIVRLQNSLEKLTQLNGYHYNWIDVHGDQRLQTGFIAQEVEKLMPELVKTDSEGIKNINYNGMVPYMVETLKEQQDKINLLEKKLEELKNLLLKKL